MFHARCLINITISLKGKKYWPLPSSFPQALPQRYTVVHFSKLSSFVGQKSNHLGRFCSEGTS